jgi:Kef-type K+ transport system membrane component KefB
MLDPALLTTEIGYVALLFSLFVLPRVLQRLNIPSAVTSLALGAVSGIVLNQFTHDSTVSLLSTFGIVSLFLFAGLEIDAQELRREGWILVEHLAIQSLGLLVVAFGLVWGLDLEPRAATLVGLALLTPSAGFILHSLDRLDATERERFWIRSKAVATEILALAILFVALQSTSTAKLTYSALALAGLVAILPLAFRMFAAFVLPYAPKSEFAFLVMTAVACGIATRELGVYYLVGAFVVGMSAQQARLRLPSLSSERMLHAVEAFSTLFVPFYFFHAGLELRSEDFGLGSLVAGGSFLAAGLPFRIFMGWIHRKWRLGESFRASARVNVPLLPTLVFTLVMAQILRDRFDVPSWLFGGLILYAIGNTLLPSLFLHAPPAEFGTTDDLPEFGRTS